MHWKKRQKQIQYLQAKHGNDRSLAREFPDLKVALAERSQGSGAGRLDYRQGRAQQGRGGEEVAVPARSANRWD